MKLAEVMKELKSLGNPQTVKTYRRHGADGPMFGVKIGDLKKVLRKIKNCLLYTSPSPRDKRQSRMPSSA